MHLKVPEMGANEICKTTHLDAHNFLHVYLRFQLAMQKKPPLTTSSPPCRRADMRPAIYRETRGRGREIIYMTLGGEEKSRKVIPGSIDGGNGGHGRGPRRRLSPSYPVRLLFFIFFDLISIQR